MFLVLLMFAEIGAEERNYLRSRGIFRTLSDFILGAGLFTEEDPAKSKSTKTVRVFFFLCSWGDDGMLTSCVG